MERKCNSLPLIQHNELSGFKAPDTRPRKIIMNREKQTI